MPVCRYPIVVSAPITSSPESCSTRRSTPCVLGCCGPMFTVMTSLRSSGPLVSTVFIASAPALDDAADGVEEGHVDLLHAARGVVRHVDVNLRHRSEGAAVPAGQRH